MNTWSSSCLVARPPGHHFSCLYQEAFSTNDLSWGNPHSVMLFCLRNFSNWREIKPFVYSWKGMLESRKLCSHTQREGPNSSCLPRNALVSLCVKSYNCPCPGSRTLSLSLLLEVSWLNVLVTFLEEAYLLLSIFLILSFAKVPILCCILWVSSPFGGSSLLKASTFFARLHFPEIRKLCVEPSWSSSCPRPRRSYILTQRASFSCIFLLFGTWKSCSPTPAA